jgi:hypothetical protein
LNAKAFSRPWLPFQPLAKPPWGKRTLILRADLDAFLRSLPEVAA